MSESVILPKHPLLQQVVEYFWVLQGTPSEEDDSTLIYPEGCMEMLLSFAGPTRWHSTDHCLTLSKSIFSPIRTCHYDVHPMGRVEYLAIRFRPHSLPLISNPVELFANRACNLEDVLDQRLWQAMQPVFSMETMPQRIAYLEELLTQWIVRGIPQQPVPFQHALHLLQRTHGLLPIQTLCHDTGLYPRKLERQFHHFLGVAPKTYARILRFNHVMDTFFQHTPTPASEFVFQAGYADQAHFIRECKEFTGRTPGDLFP
jgi:AraC-like DNA-binding protein